MGGGPALRLLALIFIMACDLPRVQTMETIKVGVIVADTSEPVVFDQRCGEVGGQAESMIESDEPTEVLVLGLGDATTGDEPRLVVDWSRYAPSTKLYGKAENTNAPWITAVVERCHASITPSARSPIYRAVARGVAALRARCGELARQGQLCKPVLVLVSDLIETQESAVAQAVRAKSFDTGELPTLERSGIEIRACGIVGRAATERPTEIGRLESVWSAVLGDLALAPTCPLWEASP